MFSADVFSPLFPPFLLAGLILLWRRRRKMPAQVLLQVIWDKKRSRATSQKIPPFPAQARVG